MNIYSQKSADELTSCHIDLQLIFTEVLKHYDHTIIQGHRTKEDQDKAYNSGRSKLQWPNSKHNFSPSMAVDAAPYPIEWNDHIRFAVFAGYVFATADRLRAEGKITFKVRWGGDWDKDGFNNDQSFNDFPHFELYL
jgi:peptidoglycan L-alanyl-D-glutamate endopeptidase CwlK